MKSNHSLVNRELLRGIEIALKEWYNQINEWLDLTAFAVTCCFSHMEHPEYLEESISREYTSEKWEVECDVGRPIVLYVGQLHKPHLYDYANKSLHLCESDNPPVTKN